MANVSKLVTTTNTAFFDFGVSRGILCGKTLSAENARKKPKAEGATENDVDESCKALALHSLIAATLKDKGEYFQIATPDYLSFKREEDEGGLVFKIDSRSNGQYTVSTGLYCGLINFGGKLPQLEITTGLSDVFFRRILNCCCGIYVDSEPKEGSNKSHSIYGLLVQYLFMVSLRKVASKAIPKKYVTLRERGYNVKGNVDVNEFARHDIIRPDKKLTYAYQSRLEIQPIVDVIYCALKRCKIKGANAILPNLSSLERYFGDLYSGVRPSRKTISSIRKERCLSNSLYADFKRPLEYAQYLLRDEDIGGGNGKAKSVSGFLVDSSFLWEMYLYHLLSDNLEGWEVDPQRPISFYEDTFFSKTNYPDFVLTNRSTGAIYILDAKLKRMEFQGRDVDNADLRQLHAYSYYFCLKYKDNFRGAALIYPTNKNKPEGLKNQDNIYGITGTNQRFGVFAIKDPSEKETMRGNETNFINELKEFLEG